jgi:transmembrane sensor
MPHTRLSILFDRYLSKSCTEAERQELAELILNKEHEQAVTALLEKAWLLTNGEMDMPEEKGTLIFNSILESGKKVVPVQKSKVIRINWRRVAVAASVIMMLGISSYFIFFNRNKQNEIVKTELPVNVEPPKGTKAMITLADGRTVALDSLTNGTLAVQGNVNVIKTADGQIVYNGSASAVEYNTLFNPRGSLVQPLTLNDGTKVWLNAESSIKFPTAFAGSERKVEVTGEAYFEVVHNTAQPFIVRDINRDAQVQVMGTNFNVNTYVDEAAMKVTLLEGSVNVTNGSAFGLLKPGQQAQISSEIKIVNSVDLEQVMAWKDGVFRFKNTNIGEIMRQVARWYNVEVDYKGNFSDLNFGGSVSRQANLLELLKRLEATEALRFKMEGRKVIVMVK